MGGTRLESAASHAGRAEGLSSAKAGWIEIERVEQKFHICLPRGRVALRVSRIKRESREYLGLTGFIV